MTLRKRVAVLLTEIPTLDALLRDHAPVLGADYEGYRNAFPNAGFHKRLLQLSSERLLSHPWSPLPMLRL